MVVSAILVGFLFNWKPVIWALGLIQKGELIQLEYGIKMRVIHTAVTFIIHILMFLIAAFFNYIWKDRLIPSGVHRTFRFMLIVFANLLLLYGSSYAETSVISAILDAFNKRIDTLYYLFANFSVFGLAVSEAYLLILFRKLKSTEIENIRLRQEKSNAELAALKEQISPHFLFNTLNSLSALIRIGKKTESLDFVDNLSQVYRYILDSEHADTVTLAEELAFVESYTYLLKKRFGDKLQIDIRIDPEKGDYRLPPMALQTLIENAVKHNELSGENPVMVRISNRDDNLIVLNNICRKSGAGGHGTGLAYLNKRYRMIAGREIEINANRSQFSVKLPILKPD